MIFCFVRETKQLTLEEIDRTLAFVLSHVHDYSKHFHRGLFRPHEAIYRLRNEGLATILHQAPYLPSQHPEAATDHRERVHRREIGYFIDYMAQFCTLDEARSRLNGFVLGMLPASYN